MDFSFLKEAVRDRECISSSNISLEQNSIHVAYGVDANFIRPMGVSMTSILENNKSLKFIFHILIDNLNANDREDLGKLSQKYDADIFIYYIDNKMFEKLPATEHFTKATYNRFLLPKVLKDIAQYVIYLDADILCLGEISDLVGLNFEGKIVSVVNDIDTVAKRQIKSLGLKENKYFNAGFLYIDIKAWNSSDISEKAIEVSFAKLGKLDWLDQDALNIVLEGKVKFIDIKYDYIFDLGGNKQIKELPKNTVFVHYAGRFKPWHEWCMHSLREDFLSYAKLSPWADISLIKPQSYKDMKKMAKSCFAYNKVTEGIKWYLKYTFLKFKSKF